jgi:hypothetical protein
LRILWLSKREAVRVEVRGCKRRGETTFTSHQARQEIVFTFQHHDITYTGIDLYEKR